MGYFRYSPMSTDFPALLVSSEKKATQRHPQKSNRMFKSNREQ